MMMEQKIAMLATFWPIVWVDQAINQLIFSHRIYQSTEVITINLKAKFMIVFLAAQAGLWLHYLGSFPTHLLQKLLQLPLLILLPFLQRAADSNKLLLINKTRSYRNLFYPFFDPISCEKY